MSTLLVVDAGTSRTRVRLWRDGRVVDEVARQVGARDVALAGGTAPIANALRELIDAMRSGSGAAPTAVVCSGMITSNVGLVDIPHTVAPIEITELARRVVRHDVPDITDLPMYFIPGVKTVGVNQSWDSLPDFDVMRGEEAEVIGLMAQLKLQPPFTVFHCGSHHKLIELGNSDMDATSAVLLRSSTAITGELLAALQQGTILSSSLVDLASIELDMEAVEAGIRHCRALGFARAAFLVRVGETVAGRERQAVTAFLLGALAALDLQLIERELPTSQKLLVYGGGVFPAILVDALSRDGRWPLWHVGREESDAAAAIGAVKLLEAYLLSDHQ